MPTSPFDELRDRLFGLEMRLRGSDASRAEIALRIRQLDEVSAIIEDIEAGRPAAPETAEAEAVG